MQNKQYLQCSIFLFKAFAIHLVMLSINFWASIWPQQCPSDSIYTLNAQEHSSSACWGQQMPRKLLGLKEWADQLTRVQINMFHQSLSQFFLSDTIIREEHDLIRHSSKRKCLWTSGGTDPTYFNINKDCVKLSDCKYLRVHVDMGREYTYVLW